MNQFSNIDPAIFARRKRTNQIGLVLSTAAMVLGMVFLLWILSILFIKGFDGIKRDKRLLYIFRVL